MNRKTFGLTVATVVLTYWGVIVPMRLAAKRRVIEGQTSGTVGAAARVGVTAL